MTDHEYKSGWLGLRGNKSCATCGQGRGVHYKPLLDTLTEEEQERISYVADLAQAMDEFEAHADELGLPKHTATCDCQICNEAYGPRSVEAVGYLACWDFDPQRGRCRAPCGHEGEHGYVWWADDGEKP